MFSLKVGMPTLPTFNENINLINFFIVLPISKYIT